ncbi:MAG: ankyrin repeat domain-containing protein [Proteobacteria bacterium]|nr:ankyrin repeat domain-containing protein [Pseudomonadota bacterium]
MKCEQFAEAMADAAEEGDNKKIKMLIEQGADVNCPYDDNSPLHYAIRGNQ